MKKLVILLLVLTMLAVTVNAQSSFVEDGSALLTPEQSGALNEQMLGYQADFGVSIGVVTTDSLDGKSIETYAGDYYANSGYTNDCAILLICENEGQWYIYTHGLCATYITDMDLMQIGDLILDDLQTGNYYEAVQTFMQRTAEPVCEEIRAMNDEAQQLQKDQNKRIVFGLVGGLAVGVAVSVLLGYAAKAHRVTPKAKPEPRQQEPQEKAE